MIEVEVNNRKVQVEEGWPLIEVCRIAGVELPRFCYHESLGIAGNCRMCYRRRCQCDCIYFLSGRPCRIF